MSGDPFVLARECFLNLFAEAPRFDDDPDVDGMQYDLKVEEECLRDLIDAFGIDMRPDETAGDAIRRRLNEDKAERDQGDGQPDEAQEWASYDPEC